MRYYIIAGERSGDLHGGNLVRSILKRDSQAVFRGFGGDEMEKAGVEILIHYNQMAFMGFVEVVSNLWTITGYLKKCKKDIESFNPDVIILIDYAGFNRQVARFATETKRNVFYYISPKVWAWRQGRAVMLKKNVTRMFVILPFEVEFYKRYNWDVDYVGNPVLDTIRKHVPEPTFLKKHNLDNTKPLVAFLPGSRKQELALINPVLAEVAKRNADYQFIVACVGNMEDAMYSDFRDIPNVILVKDDQYNVLSVAKAAIVTSGTATLETALFNVPQVVVYKTNPVSYLLAKFVIRVPFISLVNLVAGKEVVKELIQKEVNSPRLSDELKLLIANEANRERILAEYNEVYTTLDAGGSASANAAALMIKYLNEKN